jgi:glycosyltransferase involved in cell wall biosynthesis
VKKISREQIKAPARIVDIELTSLGAPRTFDIAVTEYRTVWCLARVNGVPVEISFWDVEKDSTVRLDELHDGHFPIEGSTDGDLARGISRTELTVVICTRDRPEQLRRALVSLTNQSDLDFEVLIIDNAPSSNATAVVAEEMNLDRCEYVVEPRGGLSRARNRALSRIRTDHVAWIDDGEVADPEWVRCLKVGLAHPSNPLAVCGAMYPAELETEAQVRFEQFGGFNKGRSIFTEILSANSPSIVNPLYPLPAVGSGGNMAFQVDALRSVGGFDEFLGTGTRTHGGDETKVFATLLRSGGTILHWPRAITWHFHRRTMAELHKQFYGYSAGLSAFYVSMIRSNPRVVLELPKLTPLVLRDLGIRSGGIRADQLPADFPKSLLRASRRGMLAGGLAYLYEALSDRRGQSQ